jgi:hypothetical protein
MIAATTTALVGGVVSLAIRRDGRIPDLDRHVRVESHGSQAAAKLRS